MDELNPDVLLLIKRKAAGEEVVEFVLTMLAYELPAPEFRMFCRHVRMGRGLKEQFATRKISGNPATAWRRFAMSVLAQVLRNGEQIGPEHCELSPAEKKQQLRKWGKRKRKTDLRPTNLFAAKLGDVAAIKTVRYAFCVGCPQTKCVHHLAQKAKSYESGTFARTEGGQQKPPRRLDVVA